MVRYILKGGGKENVSLSYRGSRRLHKISIFHTIYHKLMLQIRPRLANL